MKQSCPLSTRLAASSGSGDQAGVGPHGAAAQADGEGIGGGAEADGERVRTAHTRRRASHVPI